MTRALSSLLNHFGEGIFNLSRILHYERLNLHLHRLSGVLCFFHKQAGEPDPVCKPGRPRE